MFYNATLQQNKRQQTDKHHLPFIIDYNRSCNRSFFNIFTVILARD